MPIAKLTRTIDVPASKIWAVLSDFSNIQIFHPNVQDVDQLSEMDRGLGASRRCNFYGGDSAVEEIIEWDDERHFFTCTVTEISAPILDVTAGMKVDEIDSQSSEVEIYMNYTPKWGILGTLINVLVLRFAMQSVFNKVLKGLELHLKTGKMIGKDGKPTLQTSQANAT